MSFSFAWAPKHFRNLLGKNYSRFSTENMPTITRLKNIQWKTSASLLNIFMDSFSPSRNTRHVILISFLAWAIFGCFKSQVQEIYCQIFYTNWIILQGFIVHLCSEIKKFILKLNFKCLYLIWKMYQKILLFSLIILIFYKKNEKIDKNIISCRNYN